LNGYSPKFITTLVAVDTSSSEDLETVCSELSSTCRSFQPNSKISRMVSLENMISSWKRIIKHNKHQSNRLIPPFFVKSMSLFGIPTPMKPKEV